MLPSSAASAKEAACADANTCAGSQWYPSTVRRSDLATGAVLEEHVLPSGDWGEGLTLLHDTCAT